MNIPTCRVDAFSKGIFGGNPAAACVLYEWLDDDPTAAAADYAAPGMRGEISL